MDTVKCACTLCGRVSYHDRATLRATDGDGLCPCGGEVCWCDMCVGPTGDIEELCDEEAGGAADDWVEFFDALAAEAE